MLEAAVATLVNPSAEPYRGRVRPQAPRRRKIGLTVYWQPRDDAYFRLAAMLRTSREAAPLYVVQRVIADVEAHCHGSSSPLVYGLLIGERCVEPKTNREYVLIDGALHAPPYASTGDPAAVIAPNLDALAAEAARHGKTPLGWYRGGTTAVAAKARAEVAFHRRHFTEAWQALLVIDGGGVSRGTFLRIEPGDGRAYAAPFHELLPKGTKAIGGRLRTAVGWENYHTLNFVAPRDPAFVPRQAPADTQVEPSFLERPVAMEMAPDRPLMLRELATPAEVRFAPPAAPVVATASPPVLAAAPPNVRAVAAPPSVSEVAARHEVVTFPIIVPPRDDGNRGGVRALRRRTVVRVSTGVAHLAARLGSRRPQP